MLGSAFVRGNADAVIHFHISSARAIFLTQHLREWAIDWKACDFA